jgi:hypothetical protein
VDRINGRPRSFRLAAPTSFKSRSRIFAGPFRTSNKGVDAGIATVGPTGKRDPRPPLRSRRSIVRCYDGDMPKALSPNSNPYQSPQTPVSRLAETPLRLGPTGVVIFFVIAAINSGPLFCWYDWPSGTIRDVLNAILWSQDAIVDRDCHLIPWGLQMFAFLIGETVILTVLIGLIVRLGLRRPVTI